jgi:formylglycine-generating enzyme required for sulfatase activity
MGQYAWFALNSASRTQAVGQKLANAYGLVDMSGNVWEWVWDWYALAYPSGSSTNYMGPSTGSLRGSRGGSFFSDANFARAAYRGRNDAVFRNSPDGFRLARTVP